MNSQSDPSREGGRARPQGVLVGSADSGGALAIIEYEIPALSLVAPLHTHEREDEYSYVIAGRLGVQLGGETLEFNVGGMAAKPRGTAHTLWNPGETPTRVLEVIAPGGFERCLSELMRPGQRPTPARVQELWAEYGIDMQPDSAEELLRRHGLRRSLTPM